MRKNKYRGQKLNGDYVYGYFCLDSIGNPRIINIDDNKTGLIFHGVIKGSVDQYIGIKDMNNIEIYENDVLARFQKPKCTKECCKNDREYICTGVVQWNENMLCYVTYEETYKGLPFGDLENEEIEIVANNYVILEERRRK
jgi:hypothetical protein